MKEYICPVNIITERLQLKNKNSLFLEKDKQICVEENDVAEISGCGSLILDFGKEINGGIRLLINRSDNSEAVITFGESLGEAMAKTGLKNAVIAHTLREINVVLPDYSDLEFGNTGFRFVRIEFKKESSVKIKNVYAINNILCEKPLWVYDGENVMLKRVFDVAKRTIDLCAGGQYIYDGIKRDRLVWAGDIYPEMLALTTIYGDLDIVRRTILFCRNTTPYGRWMNDIPSYSVWWILTVSDFCKIVGDYSFFRENYEYITGVLRMLDAKVSENGEIDFENSFMDLLLFNDREKEIAALRALMVFMTENLAETFAILGYDAGLVEKINGKLKLKPVDSYGEKCIVALKHFAGLALSATEEELLKSDEQGYSAFMSYFVLSAVYDLYGETETLRQTENYFMGMIKLGATTFFETFDSSWAENSVRIDEMPVGKKKNFFSDYGFACFKGYRKSLCHGWSSGIIRLIYKMNSKNSGYQCRNG